MQKENKKKDKRNAAIAGAATETVQRYGSAAKEHLVAYSGIDNEAGKELKRSLKSVSKQKVNPDYKSQNLKQQSGFSAEIKETANSNAESIIKGSTKRKVRTDDVGRVNDPLYDHIEIDANGNFIAGSGTQMKFVGDSPKEAVAKLASKDFSKYLDNDVKIEVPADFYDDMIAEASEQIEKLERQLKDQINKGNSEQVDKIKKRLEDYNKIKRNLKKSSVTNKDAMFARTHPKLSTAKSIAKISHRAGIETARTSAVIGGSVSIVQNIVAVIKDEEDSETALKNIAKDTATSAVVGYGTGFTGSAVKGLMQNAKSQTAQALSKTNLPGVIVTVAIGATKTLNSYFKGDINGAECFEQLGEQGTGMLSSALFSTIGQALIPIPIVGGMIGGMVGYALSSASYGVLMSALKEEKLAKEERILAEKACEEHIKLIKQYRKEMEDSINEYLSSYMETFHSAFDSMKDALQIGNIDGFISSTNQITKALGKNTLFETQEECDSLMESDTIIKF